MSSLDNVLLPAGPFIDDVAPPAQKTLWFAVLYLFPTVGIAAGYIFGGLVGPALGWPAPFFIQVRRHCSMILLRAAERTSDTETCWQQLPASVCMHSCPWLSSPLNQSCWHLQAALGVPVVLFTMLAEPVSLHNMLDDAPGELWLPAGPWEPPAQARQSACSSITGPAAAASSCPGCAAHCMVQLWAACLQSPPPSGAPCPPCGVTSRS